MSPWSSHSPDLSGRVALVTGAAGFLGSHLTEALVANGADVRALDDLSAGPDHLLGMRDVVRGTEGDMRDPALLAPLAEGADVIFHLAARRSGPDGFADPVGDHDVNAQGTLCVLEAARAARVRRVVLASSWRVYGACPDVPLVETLVVEPDSPFAVQKHCGELYAGLYARLHGLETVCLRYFPVFGPRQGEGGDAADVLALARAGAAGGSGAHASEPVSVAASSAGAVAGASSAGVDVMFVADAVHATLLAASAERVVPGGTVVNVGSGRPAGDSKALAGLLPEQDGGRQPRVADLTRAKDVLGYAAAVGVEEGFTRTVAWLSQEGGR